MNKKYQLLLLITFILFSAPCMVFAQGKGGNIVVSSMVTDESGNALEGVDILNEKGTVISTTDQNGNFSVQAKKNSILHIRHKGFKSIEVSVQSAPDKLVLMSLPFLMDESDKVPILFGEVKRRETVGASYTLDPSEFFKYDNVRSVSGGMNGRVPGMLGANNIRGIGNALFLIDGLPRDISDINIEEVDKITVLKDANAAALYGGMAANGIVQITTKRGQAYRQKLNVIAEKGIAMPVALPQYLGSAEYMKYRNQAAINDGIATAPFSPETIENYASGKNPYRYPDVDLYSSEYLKRYLNQSKVAAEFSGGNKVTRYYASLGWTGRGTLYNIGDAADASYNKFNVRSNIDINVTNFIKAYIGVAMVFNVNKDPVGNFWNVASTLQPYRYSQLLPLSLMTHDMQISDGSSLDNAFKVGGKYILGGSTLYTDNVYGNQSFGSYSTNIDRSLQYTQGVAVDLDKFIKGLNFNAAVSFDFFNSFQQGVSNAYAVYEPMWTDQDSISGLTRVGADLRTGTQTANGAYFQRRNNVSAAFDYHRELGGGHNLSATVLGFFTQLRQEDLLDPQKNAHLGARVSYHYAGKYLADFSSAYVNGYKFAPGHKGGFSPSLGLAWVISDEHFLSNAKAINFLKLRASAGIINYEPSGNDYTLYSQTFGNYNGAFGWDDGQRSLPSRTLIHAANEALTFQKSKTFNLGLEGYFFDQVLALDANAFLTKRTGLVVQRSTYPSYLANYIPYENYNETDYKGLEAGLVWKLGRKKDTGLDIGVNMLYSTSERVKVDEMRSEPYLNRQGQPDDAMFGLEAIGLFDSWETIQSSPQQAFTAVKPGDIRYKDQNNDGVINEDDLVYIGNSQARLSFGLSLLARYKNLSLFAMATARQGGYSYNNSGYYWVQGEDRYSVEVLNSWTEATKATATYPRLSYGNNTNNFRPSTFWLYKNDFIRLERVQLNYDLPSGISNILFSRDISFFLRGENLLRFSKDAEKRQLVIGGEPDYRGFLLGLKVKF